MISSCPKMISIEKWKIVTPLQKLPKIVGNLGKIIVSPQALKSCPKCNKLPNLVTLIGSYLAPTNCFEDFGAKFEFLFSSAFALSLLRRMRMRKNFKTIFDLFFKDFSSFKPDKRKNQWMMSPTHVRPLEQNLQLML